MQNVFNNFLNGFMANDFVYNVNQQGDGSNLNQLEFPKNNYTHYQSDILDYGYDKDISYNLNSFGFRCDEFDSSLSNSNFLFSGCSTTFGLGIPQEKSWPYLLNSELKGNNFYNLSVPAMGIESIIFNINTYINNFGVPKAIFILFPNIGRSSSFVNNFGPENLYLKTSFLNDDELNMGDVDFRTNLYRIANTISLFENFCNARQIPLLWSSWHKSTIRVFNELNMFKNMFDISNMNKIDLMSEDVMDAAGDLNQKYITTARDGKHPGVIEHAYYYKYFKELYRDRYETSNS